MTRIRIILADLPGLLRGVLGGYLTREPDIEIVGNVDRREEIAALVRQTLPHVVVCGERGTSEGGPPLDTELRHMAIPVTVITISAKGDRAVISPPHQKPVELQDLSTGTIAQAIRRYAAVNGSTRLPPA